jgi:hypothetical protein
MCTRPLPAQRSSIILHLWLADHDEIGLQRLARPHACQRVLRLTWAVPRWSDFRLSRARLCSRVAIIQVGLAGEICTEMPR